MALNKLLRLVGYDGITSNHSYSVNDLPFAHDELLSAVSYTNNSEQADLFEYFTKISRNSLRAFSGEVVSCLSANAKFSDTLLRFPEGKYGGAPAIQFLSGQTVEQVYDISNVLQYGLFSPTGLLMYVKGNYYFKLSVRMDYNGLFKGGDIFSHIYNNENAAASDFTSIIEVDLSDSEFKKVINSKTQNQVVVSIQFYQNTELYPQDFIEILPTIGNITQEFSVSGSFSQGFSDGFSIAKGSKIGTINPVISFVQSTIAFDVDAFISQNSDRLAYCFAHRIAARLLADKFAGSNLNIFTNTPVEITEMQLAQTEKSLQLQLKNVTSSLLFNIQSTATPPIELKGSTGYEMGSFVGNGTYSGGKGDLDSYPQGFIG